MLHTKCHLCLSTSLCLTLQEKSDFGGRETKRVLLRLPSCKLQSVVGLVLVFGFLASVYVTQFHGLVRELG